MPSIARNHRNGSNGVTAGVAWQQAGDGNAVAKPNRNNNDLNVV